MPRPSDSRTNTATSVSELSAEVRSLQARLTELTDEASRNAALLSKTQERELELLRAG